MSKQTSRKNIELTVQKKLDDCRHNRVSHAIKHLVSTFAVNTGTVAMQQLWQYVQRVN